jgi:hypothetical protein
MTIDSACSTADVMIIAGQGALDGHMTFMEYPDNGAYQEFLFSVSNTVARFRYSHAVLSGSYTQTDAAAISEADGMLSFFSRYDVALPLTPECIFLDRLALDLAENLIFGLMAARERLGVVRIGRVGFACLWKFKQQRVALAAHVLGIHRQFYFHGFAGTESAAAGPAAAEGEARFLENISLHNDALLMSEEAEAKRRGRYQGRDYKSRLEVRRRQFPSFSPL